MKNRKRFLRYKLNLRKWSEHGSYINSKCSLCGSDTIFFYDKYDAICCLACDTWIDRACKDPNCPYCSARPSSPLETLYFDEKRNDFRKDWRRNNYQHKNNGKVRRIQKREMYEKINLRRQEMDDLK